MYDEETVVKEEEVTEDELVAPFLCTVHIAADTTELTDNDREAGAPVKKDKIEDEPKVGKE